jgi:hypothetical protein
LASADIVLLSGGTSKRCTLALSELGFAR